MVWSHLAQVKGLLAAQVDYCATLLRFGFAAPPLMVLESSPQRLGILWVVPKVVSWVILQVTLQVLSWVNPRESSQAMLQVILRVIQQVIPKLISWATAQLEQAWA